MGGDASIFGRLRSKTFEDNADNLSRSSLIRVLNRPFQNWEILKDQYFGTLGSTLSLQARIPPFMFLTFLKPACFRKSTAFALRMPLLQCATISSAESSSFTRFGRSPSGMRRA